MSKFIIINSADRCIGSENNFRIKYSNPIERIKKIKAVNVNYPNQNYTVMSDINDKFYFIVGIDSFNVTLTEGNYSPATLATELQTQMNTEYVPDNNFTVVVDATLTFKYTIAHSTTDFQLPFLTFTANTTCKKLFGFNEIDIGITQTYTAPKCFQLKYSNMALIRSSILNGGSSYVGGKQTDDIIAFPLNGNFMDVIHWQTFGDIWEIIYTHTGGKSINEIDIKLYFEDGVTLIPTNGIDWSITLFYE